MRPLPVRSKSSALRSPRRDSFSPLPTPSASLRGGIPAVRGSAPERRQNRRAPARGRRDPPHRLPDRRRRRPGLGLLVRRLAAEPVGAPGRARPQAGPQPARPRARRARPRVRRREPARALGGLVRRSLAAASL